MTKKLEEKIDPRTKKLPHGETKGAKNAGADATRDDDERRLDALITDVEVTTGVI